MPHLGELRNRLSSAIQVFGLQVFRSSGLQVFLTMYLVGFEQVRC